MRAHEVSRFVLNNNNLKGVYFAMKKRFLSIFLTAMLVLTMVPAMALGEGFVDRLTGMYGEVEVEYRPDVRWWLAEGLNTDETLISNVQQIYDSGFGAAEFLAMPEDGADSTIYGWGSEEWTADSQLIMNKATELGLGFSLTSGTHWSNANLPDTYVWNDQPFDADNIAASKELDYATILVGAGESFDGELPRSKKTTADGGIMAEGAVETSYEEYVFQGVVAAKLETVRPESGQDYEYSEGTEPGVLDFASLTDLTADVAEADGAYTLNWTAPDDGQYALFVFWMHGTGQTAEPSVSTNYTINYMDSYGVEALIDYWNEYILTDEVRETLEKSGRGEIYMDSLEVSTYGAGGLFWGYNFKDEFEARMGYDITPYLPLIVADTGSTMGTVVKNYDYQPSDDADLATATKARNDYYQVMTEMYSENVLRPLQQWLHTLNMTLRAEPSYGFNFEISEPGAYVDDFETESFAQNAELDLFRGMLGTANMYGVLFSSETGAVFGHNYFFSMDELTRLVYLQMVNGINRTVFHGYSAIEGSEASTYWPGHEGMYAIFPERYNSRQPAAEMYPEWTQMIARNQKAMRAGTASRDIAILRTDYNFINYGFNDDMGDFRNNYQKNDLTFFWEDLELQHNGYTYDYFNPTLLLDEDNVSWTADALQPDGPAYQAIVIYQEAIDLTAAQKILEIAQSGLPVLFVNNNTENLLNNGTVIAHGEAASVSLHLSATDEEVQAVVAEIKALDNVVTVDSPADAMEALQELGVYPRVAFTEPTSEVLTISRQDSENSIYYTFAYAFKSESEAEPTAVTLSFAAAGKPYEIDDWTGKVTEIGAYEVVDGRTNVTVTLAPGESMLIAIDETDAGDGLHAVSTTADKAVLTDGAVAIMATTSGEYETMLSSGETVTTAVEVPEAIALPVWDIVVEDWNEGEKVVNTEEKFGHTTTEVYYETAKTELSFPQSALVAWKDLPATDEQLATLAGDEPSMAHVSGIATYTATFEVPAEWSEVDGALMKIESTNGCQAQVFVNGQKADGLDLRTLTIDISDLLVEGENTIEVRVASSLHNRMLQRGYSGYMFGDALEVHDYGMTGEVTVVPYVLADIG